jgi:pyruvate ferredoxin oxidoreductase alpha subunit
MVEAYRCEDAEVALVTMGSMSGTAKHVVDKQRELGVPVGVAKISAFRPFPTARLRAALGGVQVVGVLDRSAGLGAETGPVTLEVRSALARQKVDVHGYVAGLGGRDINETTIEAVIDELFEIKGGRSRGPVNRWIDVRDNAMTIRSKRNIV